MTNVSARAYRTLDWLGSVPQIAIPVYQRDYRWSQETCLQLLKDVRAIARADAGRSHFIGSILSSADGDGALTLVDGQQRVTTLMLMLAAIRDLSSGVDDEISRVAAQLILRPGGGQTRLRPHERHLQVADRLLLGRPAELGRTTLEQNYNFFLDQLTDWRLAWDGLQRLEHVSIELGHLANAQQIFESLNATGAALSDDELIHNYIHMGRPHDEQVKVERDIWAPIEVATQGATREFWRDYLVLTSGSQPDFTGDFGVYRVFRSAYPDPLHDVTPEVGAEWVRLARRYEVLLNPEREPDPGVRGQLRLLQSFGTAPRPLLMGIYDDYCQGSLERESLVEICEMLQSLLIRRALVNLGRDLSIIGTLCRERGSGRNPLNRMVRLTPEDPRVRLALTHSALPQAGYVLRRLQSVDPNLTDLQVEHIYPQTPRADWSSDGVSRWGDLTTQEQADFRTLLNTIGNLTLLEAHLNAGASNSSFRQKARYYAQSQVPETRALADRSTWGAPEIRERTTRMIEQFLSTWARPAAVPMDEPEDMVRAVDLSRPSSPADPDIFEYVVFEDEIWGDVHRVRPFFERLCRTLWKRDPERFLSTESGSQLVSRGKVQGVRYIDLAPGAFLYSNWWPNYLLSAAQDFITAFGLEDSVRVKLAEAADSPKVVEQDLDDESMVSRDV